MPGSLSKDTKGLCPRSADTSAFKQTRRPGLADSSNMKICSTKTSKDRVVRSRRNHVREKSIMNADAEN